jgi:hypothetical protein
MMRAWQERVRFAREFHSCRLVLAGEPHEPSALPCPFDSPQLTGFSTLRRWLFMQALRTDEHIQSA